MGTKELTDEQKELIKKSLPVEAITQHPTKTYLSSIKAIYVLERLNEVFWIGAWTVKTEQIWEVNNWMVVVKVTFEIPTYWIYYECFGWNDNWWEANKNFDLWDAYKWATTDAITKICSYIGIWADVFKWKQKWWSNTKSARVEDLYIMTKKDVENWNGKIYWLSVYIDWDKKTISNEQIAKLKKHDKYIELPPKK